MKLLLDEMHSPAVAAALCEHGHDVVAIAAEPALKTIPDREVLTWAASGHRALVTENVSDFRLLADGWAALGRTHHGIVYTSPVRFPRSSSAYPRSLIRALSAFLTAPPPLTSQPGWEWWLRATDHTE